MTRADKIRKFLKDNGMFSGCNEACKQFIEQTGIKIHYSEMHRIHKRYEPTDDGDVVAKPGAERVKESFKTQQRKDRFAIEYEVWDNVPEQHIPRKTHIGSPIWVAGFPKREKMLLVEVHEKGDPQWPHSDGCTVLDNSGKKRYFELETCRLHPNGYKRRQKRKRNKNKTAAQRMHIKK